MLTAPDWALGSRYLRENAPELIPFIEKYGLARLLPVLFPSSFRQMSAWQWSSAWKKPSERP